MGTIMDIEMDWDDMRNEAVILHMAWRFWEGIHVFGKCTREEAAGALLGFANNRIPPIGKGNETEVPPCDKWLNVSDIQYLRLCV